MKKPSLFLRGIIIIIEEDPFPSVKIFHALQIMKATKCSISVIVKPNNNNFTHRLERKSNQFLWHDSQTIFSKFGICTQFFDLIKQFSRKKV